jgi:branched-chain amino acid transport system permease protein
MRAQPLQVAGLAVPLGLAAASFVVPNYWLTLLTYSGMGALVVVGLVMMTGFGGITSFGQAAFAGLGAYATALLTTGWSLSPWIGLATGLAVAVGSAFLIGWITVRLSGHYLVLGTFAWSISLFYAFANLEGLGGYNGIGGVPALFGGDRVAFNLLVWVAVAVAIAGAIRVLDSRFGRAVRAGPSKAMAEAFGIDTARTKLVLFVLAAALAAFSGWLQAHYLRIVNPGPFHLNASVEYLFMGIIGGIGSFLGAVLGALAVTISKSWLQSTIPGFLGTSANFEGVAYGLLVLLLLHGAPRGLSSLLPSRFSLRPRLAAQAGERLPGRTKPARGSVVLEIERVSKSFSGLQALRDVSFTLRAGEIVALVGPNGAGKSTLFNVVTGLAAADAGTVRLGQIDGASSRPRELARAGMARTFQHAHLRPEMSVVENVAVGAHTRSTGGAVSALLHLGRAEEIRILSEAQACLDDLGIGAEAPLTAGALPLGKQRLVEVARALASDPVVMLLDEPAAGLREGEKAALAQAIRDMRDRGIAVLVVEHDLDFVADVAERVIVLDFGTVIAEGSPAAVTRDPKVVEAYIGTQEAAA